MGMSSLAKIIDYRDYGYRQIIYLRENTFFIIHQSYSNHTGNQTGTLIQRYITTNLTFQELVTVGRHDRGSAVEPTDGNSVRLF